MKSPAPKANYPWKEGSCAERLQQGSPSLRGAAEKNAKNLQNVLQLCSALETQIFVFYQEVAQSTGTVSRSARSGQQPSAPAGFRMS